MPRRSLKRRSFIFPVFDVNGRFPRVLKKSFSGEETAEKKLSALFPKINPETVPPRLPLEL